MLRVNRLDGGRARRNDGRGRRDERGGSAAALRGGVLLAACALLLALAALGGGCAGESSSGSSSSTSSGSGGGSSTSSGTAGGGALGGGGGSSTSSGTAGSGGAPVGLPDLGSLVVLGDSIGDGGGVPPYYYVLLRQSLETEYGPIDYHNAAQSGSETGALGGQIGSLPATLPGPVAVAITSGGNDMKAHIAEIATGTDGPARTAMGDNVDAALDALLAPGRFGSGVQVHVYYANIYDSSDGQGNFGDHGCAISLPLVLPTDAYFDSWNGELAARVGGQGQALVDIHDLFYGHGFNNPPNWYASDCTHPNSTGHDELRKLFYWHITGKLLP